MQITGQLPQKAFYPFATLHGLKAQPVNARAAFVGPNQMPSMTEDVCPVDLVIKRIEAVGRLLLGLGIKLPLERPDRLRGG
ncbi:MAG: hypothetical protein ACO31B_09055 [Burkholderiaceae bacterium]